MLALLVDDQLFTGDTLFRGSVGGVRAPGSTSYADLKSSIMDTILTLPGETVLRPGHTEPSTVAEELENNPFVRIWRGLDDEGDEPCKALGDDATLVLGGRITTAATRPGCAGRTAATTSSRAPRSTANVDGVSPRRKRRQAESRSRPS